MSNEKIYCIYCGAENDPKAELCTKCGKKLNEEENLFKDFLIDHTKDKIKGKLEDTVFDAVKGWLLSHLYACIVTVCIIVTAATAAAGTSVDAKKTDARPQGYENIETIKEEINTPDDAPDQRDYPPVDIDTITEAQIKEILETSPYTFESTTDDGRPLTSCPVYVNYPGVEYAGVIYMEILSYDGQVISSIRYIADINFEDGTYCEVEYCHDHNQNGEFEFYSKTLHYRDGTHYTEYSDGHADGTKKASLFD